MAEFLDQLKHFSKHLGKGVSELFKKEAKRPVQLQKLASMVVSDGNSRKDTKTLLGLVFNFYKLKIGPISLRLETKGKNDEQILEFYAEEDGEVLFSYKSYEKEHSLKEKHFLPEYVHVHLNNE